MTVPAASTGAVAATGGSTGATGSSWVRAAAPVRTAGMIRVAPSMSAEPAAAASAAPRTTACCGCGGSTHRTPIPAFTVCATSCAADGSTGSSVLITTASRLLTSQPNAPSAADSCAGTDGASPSG
ncbi:hypothetical protein ACFQZK_10965 [Rhodococcus aetherivorans]